METVTLNRCVKNNNADPYIYMSTVWRQILVSKCYSVP